MYDKRRTTTTISALPDVLLKRILTSLPLADLLRLGTVSQRWRRLQTSVCKKVTVLTILVGDDALKEIEGSVFRIAHAELLRPKKEEGGHPNEGSPSFSTSSSSSPHHISPHGRHVLSFDWLDEASCPSAECRNFFTRGEKSWRQNSFALDPVVTLISALSSQLVTLQLYSYFLYSCTTTRGCSIEQPLKRLFSALNRCTALQHLTLENTGTVFFYDLESASRRPPLELPILSTLEELYFHFADYSAEICRNLERYALGNARLSSLNLASVGNVDLERPFFRSHRRNYRYRTLFSAIQQLPSFQVIDAEEDLRLLTEQLRSIVKLTVNVFTLTEFYATIKELAKLQKLLFLELCFHINPDEELSGDWREKEEEEKGFASESENSTPSLDSVRILQIYATLHCHDDLHCIHWERLFPNVEILEFDDGKMICERCRRRAVDNNDNEEVLLDGLEEEERSC
ncbi:hypothetical protein TYRP_003838 [Tyrophagus putrescentiae]|nr:hypothetical protein TYRP_003838 [Tyrophagus putrescentiae]